MKLRDYQQSLAQEALALLEEKYNAHFGKTLMLRSMMRGSGKHQLLTEQAKRVFPNCSMSDIGTNWPDVCVYDEGNILDGAMAREYTQKFRVQKARGAMAESPKLIDIKEWLTSNNFSMGRVQRHPVMMTVDDWRASTVVDIYFKACAIYYRPQLTDFNRLLTIYWHNYYMDDLQGTLDSHTLALLTNGYKVAAHGLFNTVPRLTYVRYCIAQAIVFGGNDNASDVD